MSELPPVLLLAGGVGSRLQSVVNDVPKPLARVAGKPFLQWHLDHLAANGIRKIVISAGYKAECFSKFLENQKSSSLSIELVTETERLGTGGAVIFALRQSEILRANLSFFCLNADSFTDWNPLSMMLETPEMHGALLALKVDDPSRYGTLKFDLAGNLQSFEEKTLNPTSSYINGGVYHFQKTLFEKDNMIKSSLEYDLFPRWLHENKNLGVVKSASGFIDIGTPESFQLAQSFFEHKS